MTIIIALCLLLLVAYLFDLTAARTQIPSVILLLVLGWFVREATLLLDIEIPDLSSTLPILGTIGLILIVLEGSLELELNKSKIGLIKKSSLGAFLPLVVLAIALAYMMHYYGGYSFKDCLTNAIPFCVISSAIAIPSVRNLSKDQKEFIIYESSLSDIFGVILFNFVAFNATFGLETFGYFCLELLIIIVISFVATILLSFLLNKIDHHIKFVPIILLIILIYEISKIWHLPALIFILVFGLSIGNLDELKGYKWTQSFRLDLLNKEVSKFKELIIEATFLVRALFFLLFGYLIKTSEIINTDTLGWAGIIVLMLFVLRFIQLKMSKIPLSPLLFVAPRGLITILLFLTIAPESTIDIVNKSLIIQVILLTAIVMMLGLMITSKKGEQKIEKPIEGTPEESPLI
ncbi:sodium:proton antiporter [Flavobacterium sp. F-380]|uniref:Sodium:proton antiporter n=1 Tax=Flavobacterium kayseriense TaxID=2764714 RepID=A0ABR7J9D9_9FLAO|nr:sodium:proton antiporter [Flavobacterium kayseriense]MBC5842156.1 sodium:proton antiporter [Flavobacterium kayseriense]MBC5848686.1 sodium:proton antiporter [Flavobacterium kayseriense]MBU0941361.1 cation:proton antiporter [Bacteroidota bacterium]